MSVRLLTAPGAGAVAVLEFRGPRARADVTQVCPAVSGAPLGSLRRARLELAGEPLDDVLVWIASRELIELHLHGSPVLVGRLLTHFRADAAPTLRGRSLEAAAEQLLSGADSDPAARILLDQLQGELRHELEAILSFGDNAAIDRLERLRAQGAHAALCLSPPKVVLVGPVNAGKSTLFNALVGARRAIVSALPGATRDVLSAHARLGEWPIELLDTAGERELDSATPTASLEQAGQALARGALAAADWVVRLWPGDSRAPPARTDSPPRNEVWIESRADLASAPLPHCSARVSAALDPSGAVQQLASLYRNSFSLARVPWTAPYAAPFDARSRDAVQRACDAARRGESDWRLVLRRLLDG